MAIDRLLRQAAAQIALVDPATAATTLDRMLVVDVREPSEVLQGYLPGAINVPRGLLEFRAENDVAFSTPERPILLYSGAGKRSALAAFSLKQLGFENVFSLAGGIERWQREDRPVD